MHTKLAVINRSSRGKVFTYQMETWNQSNLQAFISATKINSCKLETRSLYLKWELVVLTLATVSDCCHYCSKMHWVKCLMCKNNQVGWISEKKVKLIINRVHFMALNVAHLVLLFEKSSPRLALYALCAHFYSHLSWKVPNTNLN